MPDAAEAAGHSPETVGIFKMKVAEVNGEKRNRCVHGRVISRKENRTGEKLSGEKKGDMKVFSDDFAAVDVREELCHHSLTETA